MHFSRHACGKKYGKKSRAYLFNHNFVQQFNLIFSVPSFEASKYLVTNKEFYEFVKDEGYKRRSLWSDEGWEWLQFRQASHPIFWVCDKGNQIVAMHVVTLLWGALISLCLRPV